MGDSIPVKPKRGGIHPTYGQYIGGSVLDDNYELEDSVFSFAFHTQLRTVKSLASIEKTLMCAMKSTTTIKFNGSLEPISGESTEIDKERFVAEVEESVCHHGQQSFYAIRNGETNKVQNILEDHHYFTVEQTIQEFERRAAFENIDSEAFDALEISELHLSRLVVESLCTTTFREKIKIRYGHRKNFRRLPGSVYFMMALETCNASVSHDVEGAKSQFEALTLDTYPGENLSDFASAAQKLIKIMKGDYALPVNTGSKLLAKVTKTSSEFFNRKMFGMMDHVYTMEQKYKCADPKGITLDAQYSLYGPLAIIAEIHQAYGHLVTAHEWPALASKLPQSNNAPTSEVPSGKRTPKCFRCKGPHLIKDCPQKDDDTESDNQSANGSTTTEGNRGRRSNNRRGNSKQYPTKREPLAAWKSVEPKDLTVPLICRSTLVDLVATSRDYHLHRKSL